MPGGHQRRHWAFSNARDSDSYFGSRHVHMDNISIADEARRHSNQLA
jgi:hypothetical protein